MANPKPRTDHLKPYQWKPGQSGNQGNKGPRFTTRLEKFLDDNPQLEKDLLMALAAMATGRRSLIADVNEEGGKRKPNLDWFKELRELVQGKPTERQEVTTKNEPAVVELPKKDLHGDDSSTEGTAN